MISKTNLKYTQISPKRDKVQILKHPDIYYSKITGPKFIFKLFPYLEKY